MSSPRLSSSISISSSSVIPSTRVSWLVHDVSDLRAAQERLHPNLKSVCLALTHPGLLQMTGDGSRLQNTTLNNFLTSLSQLPHLQELRLSIRGVGKSGTEQENCYRADALAEVVALLSDNLDSLELVISKLQGSLSNLAQVLTTSASVERVILHQCDTDTPQGLLPLIYALSQMTSLKTLILENTKFPEGDITTNALVQLGQAQYLQRLEIKQCVNLTDDELIPLVSSLPYHLKHLKLSTGLLQMAHREAQWGSGAIEALAKTLRRSSSTSLVSLAVTTPPRVSLMPLISALEQNTSVKRLCLYNGRPQQPAVPFTTPTTNKKKKATTKPPKTMVEELTRIVTNTNMTLEHCNHLGGTLAQNNVLHFYTRLNQLQRRDLWTTTPYELQCQKWIDLLVQERNDHRIVHYLLSNHPEMIASAAAGDVQ